MLFNSFQFALFLPVVFTLYWLLNKHLRFQNLLLLVASYYFYASWDFRFLFLLLFSTLLDYYSGIQIAKTISNKQRKAWLWISVATNICLLGFFKYYNFFAEEFGHMANYVGWKVDPWILSIILPIGISFYTFHGLSYVFDIYNKRTEPVHDFVHYAVFVSFFPLLVAGPIERATHLLPQIRSKKKFDYVRAVDGLRQILWGLFKKLVIADNCAVYANMIFNDYQSYTGTTLIAGALFFSFQIYCDFSGYSDIALGTARLFGIELLRNFAFPYFSRDISEFWRRWHISLSSWFRDYLYIPLGGSKGSTWIKIRNTFLIFMVSGFWHGANWTYIFWGALNALYFIPYLLTGKNRNNLDIVAQGKLLPSIEEVFKMVFTFLLISLAWVFFRSNTLTDAFNFIYRISIDTLQLPRLPKKSALILLLVLLFIMIEWAGRTEHHALAAIGLRWPRIARWGFYFCLIFIIGMFMETTQTPFIYFQF